MTQERMTWNAIWKEEFEKHVTRMTEKTRTRTSIWKEKEALQRKQDTEISDTKSLCFTDQIWAKKCKTKGKVQVKIHQINA